MKRVLAGVAMSVAAGALLAGPAWAALKVGAKAPDFTAQASQAGKPFTFSLKKQLRKGPVVLYFYPAAFTSGCNAEAHAFAEATPQFAALGATVIGVSHDGIDKLDKFSSDTRYCSGKFPVVADPQGTVIKSYDATLAAHPEYANRTSYVIAPDGTVLYEYTAMDPSQHVGNTMAAVKAWKDSHPKG
jgi:peroxiredoxin